MPLWHRPQGVQSAFILINWLRLYQDSRIETSLNLEQKDTKCFQRDPSNIIQEKVFG